MNLSSLFTSGYSNTAGNTSADVYATVSKIMQSQNTGVPKLNAALANDDAKLSGLGKLMSALASFQSVAQSLSGSGIYTAAASSAKDVLTATSSSTSVPGAYAVQVTQLAQAQNLLSRIQANPDAVIGSGGITTLTFDFGTTAGDTFTPNAAMTPQTVLIPSGGNTLQGIANAINAANIGVTARVIHNAAGYALVLSSSSGSANSMRIGAKGDPALQNLLAYDPAGAKNMTQTSAAQDAALTINGVAKSSSGNTVTDAPPGTTLNLKATGTSTLTVARDSTQFTKNVGNLVSAFNTLNASLKSLQQGDLKTEGSAARIHGQLARIFNTASSGSVGAAYITPGSIGISTQKNGDLAIDAAKLQKAINAAPEGVAKLFTHKGKGIADNLVSQIKDLIGTHGSIQKEAATINQDIMSLTAKKSSLAKALTLQANSLVKKYSQQNTPYASSNAPGLQSPYQSNGKATLFSILG